MKGACTRIYTHTAKNCCIPHGAPLLILWLAGWLPGWLTDWLDSCPPACALFECQDSQEDPGPQKKKKKMKKPKKETPLGCKLGKYLFKNFTLKCICG